MIPSDFQAFLWDELGSTMDGARELCNSSHASEQARVVLARRQIRGRGRAGREWIQAGPGGAKESESSLIRKGNFVGILDGERDVLPLTLVFPSQRLAIPIEWMTLSIGCALVDTLRGTLRLLELLTMGETGRAGLESESLVVKWPNDVLVVDDKAPPRKICGVLCETSFRGESMGDLLIGVGVNLFQAPDLPVASSLVAEFLRGTTPQVRRKRARLLERRAVRDMILSDFCARLQSEIVGYLETPRTVGQLRSLILERTVPMGTLLSVNGGEVQGRFRGIDAQARLQIEGCESPLIAGDVSLASSKAPDAAIHLPVRSAASDQRPVLAASAPRPAFSTHQNSGSRPLPDQRIEMAVACDFGNTRLHIGYLSGLDLQTVHVDRSMLSVANETGLLRQLRGLLTWLRGASLVKLPFVTVLSRSETSIHREFISDFLVRNLPFLKVEWDEISSPVVLDSVGLSSQYTVNTLGADRALRFRHAARLAKERGLTVLMCGVGTAVTLEAVNPLGKITESGILPGFRLMLESLHNGTAQLPPLNWPARRESDEPEELSGAWTTESTLREGVELAVAGAVTRAAEVVSAGIIILSGGDSPLLGRLISDWATQFRCELRVEGSIELRELLNFFDWRKGENCEICPPLETKSEPEELESASEESLGAAADVVNSLRRSRKRKTVAEATLRSWEHFRRLGPRVETDCLDVRLDRHLASRYRFHTRIEWRRRILDGDILIQHGASGNSNEVVLGGSTVKHTYRTKLHDQLWLFHPEDHEPDCMADVEVLADDGNVVVFSKPGNLVIHAVGQYSRNTFLAIAERMGFGSASPVHRIDRETSGILLCARNAQSRREMSDAFRHGEMEKMYLAVCRPSRPLPKAFRVCAPIGDAVGSRIRLKLWINGPGALESETHFRVLSEWSGYALVACFPKTGRTNQIRIHLACIGAWIVGDKMYHRDEEVFLEFYDHGLTSNVLRQVEFPRHMLHNSAIRGPAHLPPLVSSEPAICHIPADMMSFSPLGELLRIADISVVREGQETALRELFNLPLRERLAEAPILEPLGAL